jgi:hypothetical protein
MKIYDPCTWTRSGDHYTTRWSDDINLVVALQDHRWVAAVFFRGDSVHLSEHSGQDEAFDEAIEAALRARHLRRFLPDAPARHKPDAVDR